MSNPNATIDTLIEDTMQFREFDDGIIYYTKLNAYSVLYTLYGKNVLDFIYYSLDVRASDQLTYTNEINKLLFEKIFENKYRFSFNQRIIIEKKDMINNLIALKKQGYPIEELLHKKKTSAKKIYHYEIDAQFSLSSLDEPIIRFENKLFTSPHQKGKILQKHHGKSFLEKLFSIRDFLGLITFATVVDSNQPEKLFEFPNEIKENHRTGWFLHFIVIDRNILHSKKRAETHASECIASIKNHNDFF